MWPKEFLTDLIGTLDQPKERVKESLKRATKFAQTAEFPTGTYRDMKLQLVEEAIRDGHAAGTVDPRLNSEPERCKLAVDGLLYDIHTASGVHLDDVALAGHTIVGYADGHFENWGVMTTACVRIAKRRGLDPKEQKDRSPFQRTSKYVQDTSDSESEGERMALARRRSGGRRFEAKLADQNGDTRERSPMLCSALPYQTLFKSGDKRAMPPRMGLLLARREVLEGREVHLQSCAQE